MNVIGKLYKSNYTTGLYVIPLRITKGKRYVWSILFNFSTEEKSYGLDQIHVPTQLFAITKFEGDFKLSTDYRLIFPLIFKLEIVKH